MLCEGVSAFVRSVVRPIVCYGGWVFVGDYLWFCVLVGWCVYVCVFVLTRAGLCLFALALACRLCDVSVCLVCVWLHD